MLIPTLGCPANCKYCWSSEEGSPMMSLETVREVVEWLKDFQDEQVTVTFHGGEPLLAGPDFYREALPMIAEGAAHLSPTFAIQTNLWKMTPELAKIFAAYQVPIGSSVDGPRAINDIQRGEGYFDKTMAGCRIARENGLGVKFICTFTCDSVKQKDEIISFFLRNDLTLKLHPALPSLRDRNPERWALAPEEYGKLLLYLLDQSLEHLNDIDIMNINDLVKCVFTRRGNVCTFADCMGSTFAIGPDGNIYPCYRFVGMDEYVMGNVADRPTREEMAATEAGKLMNSFREYVDKECAECPHITYCRGGCPYNAIAPSGGTITGVDPHCPAYKMIFDEISKRLNQEMYDAPIMEKRRSRARPNRNEKPGVMALLQKLTID